ncbi:MAG TPA: potassium channel family protein [Pyrinomonadaceae bacterium]|nr:potassium channel family protein [Pyrinomonadaceae bacterium]
MSRAKQVLRRAADGSRLASFSLLPFAFLLPSAETVSLALTIAGVALLLFVAYDVYDTILEARGRSGPASELLFRAVWRTWRFVCFRLSRQRRHRWLHHVGPVLLPTLIATYIVLLVVGFALLYYPRMPGHFNVAESIGPITWFESFYFSGVTLTTVGFGDITPRSTSMRVVALIEGASGFALISLAVTYLLSVYGALERKRAVALSFYHQAGEGADVAGFIAHHFAGGRFLGLEATLRVATRDIQELLEAHVEHPIIHYFHPVEVYKGLPRVLFLTLEAPSVIHACLDPDEYEQLVRHPEVSNIEASARHVLGELVASLGLERRSGARDEPTKFHEARRWRARYEQTLKKLREAGVKTREDSDAGFEAYRASREDWESPLQRFANYLGYDWDEVTGDTDLEYAADEEKERPQGGVVKEVS